MQKIQWRAVPGAVATVLMAGIAGLWVFWSLGELFYEGWGTPLPGPLLYLIPGALSLGLCLAALRWPLFGGIALILVGAWFAMNWLGSSLRAGIGAWDFLVRFFLSGLVPVLGLAFIYDHRYQRKRLGPGLGAGLHLRSPLPAQTARAGLAAVPDLVAPQHTVPSRFSSRGDHGDWFPDLLAADSADPGGRR
jgi:hypothetical protein